MRRQRYFGDIKDKAPDQCCCYQLQVCDQAGGQQQRANVRTVAELHNSSNQADHQGSKQLVSVVVVGVVQFANKKAIVQGQCQDGEEGEEDFFQVHIGTAP